MTHPTGFGPPANVSPSDLWTRLTQTPRPHKDIPFPRRGVDVFVRLVVLTEAELMACRVAAENYAKAQFKERQAAGEQNLGYGEIYRNESIIQAVCAACRDPKSEHIASRAFPNADYARGQLTSDEFAVLYSAYLDFQSESGPIIASMTPEEMDAWIEELAKGASRAPLARLSSAARDDLLMRSAFELWTLRTANTSPGSPQNEPSPSPS